MRSAIYQIFCDCGKMYLVMVFCFLRIFLILVLCCGAAHVWCAEEDAMDVESLHTHGPPRLASAQGDSEVIIKCGASLLTSVYDCINLNGGASEGYIAGFLIRLGFHVDRGPDLYKTLRFYKECLATTGHVAVSRDIAYVDRWIILRRFMDKEEERHDAAYYQRVCDANITQADVQAVVAIQEFRDTPLYKHFVRTKVLPGLLTILHEEPNPEDEMD